MTVLVADIGGTNARFAIAHYQGNTIQLENVQSFRAEDYESPRDAAAAYLEAVRVRPENACFAMAAPIDGEVIPFTNSHWLIDKAQIKSTFALKHFTVVNDFYALAMGVPFLTKDKIRSVKVGKKDKSAPILVIGPGTGLGQALIVPCKGGEQIVATQGGHVAFAPASELEIEVLRLVAKEHPRVTAERLLSGRGLINLHRALCQIHDVPRVSLQANEITEAAINGTLPVAKEAVTLFCAILGDVVGDAVLTTGAQGGAILGGGILPKMEEFFLHSPFLKRFQEKDPMTAYMTHIPIDMIITDETALYGAMVAA
ncbi:MAG: glucokinase [bacterium]